MLNVLIGDLSLITNFSEEFVVPIQFPSGRIVIEGGAGGESFTMSVDRRVSYEMSVRTDVLEDDEDEYEIEFQIGLYETE